MNTLTMAPEPATAGPAPAASLGGRWHEDSGPYRPRGQQAQVGISGLVMSADVLMAKNTFDVVARGSDVVSWAIALSVSTAATLLAFAAGKELRKGHRLNFGLFLALWVLLGAGMAVLRFLPALMDDDVISSIDLLLSAFIFLLYLGAGAKLVQTAYEMTNPMHQQLAAAMRAERKAIRRLVKAEASYARVDETLARWQVRQDALTNAADALKRQACIGGDELKQRARNEVGAILGRVEATGVYRQETWPERRDSDHPAPDGDAAATA